MAAEGAIDDQLKHLQRGVVDCLTVEALRDKLRSKRRLIVKAGFDPSAPDLHLGHTVLLRKLRQFQDGGHRVIFLIGDATAVVGDPSGQSQTRKPLTFQEVEANARTYRAQVTSILDTRPARFQLRYNSEWFAPRRGTRRKTFGFADLVSLASKYTVARLIERDDFAKRLKTQKPVSMLELFYPLMQGYDSVMLKADVELGGTDQRFNLLVGRELQREYGQSPQVVMTLPLLEGLDGTQKMSKSLGNHVGIAEQPASMFGKLMSIPDTLIPRYAELLTDEPLETFRALHPREAKARLAHVIVSGYHGATAAAKAAAAFDAQFRDGKLPEDLRVIRLATPAPSAPVVELLVKAGLVASKNAARRVIQQGGVRINRERATDLTQALQEGEYILEVGKLNKIKLLLTVGP